MIYHEFCFCKHHNKGHVQFLFFVRAFGLIRHTYVEVYECGSSTRKLLILKLLLKPRIRNNQFWITQPLSCCFMCAYSPRPLLGEKYATHLRLGKNMTNFLTKVLKILRKHSYSKLKFRLQIKIFND